MVVTALVPCYNEEQRIGRVLEVLTNCPAIKEVVVVNDGSTDGSVEVIKKYPVKLVDLAKNVGKGGALRAGIELVDTPFIFLCDADLTGLTGGHVSSLIAPVKKGYDVCVGIRYSVIDWIAKTHLLPLLAGERVLRTNALREILLSTQAGKWGLEPYMNFYSRKKGWRVKKVDMIGVKGVLNARKRGVWAYLKRLVEFVVIYLRLYAGVARD